MQHSFQTINPFSILGMSAMVKSLLLFSVYSYINADFMLEYF